MRTGWCRRQLRVRRRVDRPRGADDATVRSPAPREAIMNERKPAAEMMRLINGYQVSQAIHVAAALGIGDLLASGPRSSDDLAATTDSHPRTLYRLLRALASVEVLHETEDRRFAL